MGEGDVAGIHVVEVHPYEASWRSRVFVKWQGVVTMMPFFIFYFFFSYWTSPWVWIPSVPLLSNSLVPLWILQLMTDAEALLKVSLECIRLEKDEMKQQQANLVGQPFTKKRLVECTRTREVAKWVMCLGVLRAQFLIVWLSVCLFLLLFLLLLLFLFVFVWRAYILSFRPPTRYLTSFTTPCMHFSIKLD